MDVVAGAMGSLGPKLLQLLQDEYELQKGVKEQVESLAKELESMHAALLKVAQVPYDQLDPQVKLWASEAREASYDIEDTLDTFLVRVDGGNRTADADKGIVNCLLEKMGKMFSLSKLKARHDIAGAIERITKQVDQMAKRRDRYKVNDIESNSATTTSIDPRVWMTLGTKASELVGIDEQIDALIKMLTNEKATLVPQSKKRKIKMSKTRKTKKLTMGGDDAIDKEMKIVSVVGSGGLGKTTLVKVVYEKFTVDMNINCKAFVPVGRNPDLKKVFRDILLDLDKPRYMNQTNFIILDERQLIQEIQAFLKEKRYFIVIDDIWEVTSWQTIRTAFEENNMGSKIMITTRSSDVAKLVHCTYKIQPLHPDSSKILFYGRIFGSQDKCPESFSELSDKILKKCGGVPLAIVTVASLLANKSDDITEWQEVCSSIGSGLGNSNDMYNDMRKILSLSYYDLPSPMKSCFLYLSMYPEDHKIRRDDLIWIWISEGFIQPLKKGDDLFELGISYFNDLINRSLIQPIVNSNDEIFVCRVHDMILDLICFLSREENFVTTSDGIKQVTSSENENKKIHRLSLKSTGTWPEKDVSQVRSIAVFGPCIDSMPSFSCLNTLRVLDLQGCFGINKLCIGNLIHLRYLDLSGTGLKELPGGIEKLQFLQVLKVDYDMDLPDSIFGLRQLMCLKGALHPQQGNLLRNLASLQVLLTLYVDKDPIGTVKALGHLTQLKKLAINMKTEMVDQSICDALIHSLGKLSRLKHLVFFDSTTFNSWERWVRPPHLRWLTISSMTLPKWISPAWLPHLIYLEIRVHDVRPEDIQMLGTLPNLGILILWARRRTYLEQPLQKFVVSADAFPRLRLYRVSHVFTVPSMFTRGAMPRVDIICFSLRARDFFSEPDGLHFRDLAMDHLPSLRSIFFNIHSETEEEAAKLREVLQHAADVHPNHPRAYML